MNMFQHIYPDSIREWKVDDVILGYDRLDDGLHIYLGTFDNQVVSYDYSWNFVAKEIDGMILSRYFAPDIQIPSLEEQKMQYMRIFKILKMESIFHNRK